MLFFGQKWKRICPKLILFSTFIRRRGQQEIFCCQLMICHRQLLIFCRPKVICSPPLMICRRPQVICSPPLMICSRPKVICRRPKADRR